MISDRKPITALALFVLDVNASCETPPTPCTVKMTSPAIKWLLTCSSSLARLPPRLRYRPPTDHEASTPREPITNAPRTPGATPSLCGRSRRPKPPAVEALGTVSGTFSAMAANNNSASTMSRTYGMRSGNGAHWANAPDPTAPSAIPVEVEALFTSPAARASLRGCSSVSAAAAAPVNTPVANPWTPRARKSQPVSLANRKITRLPISALTLPSSTRRRPMRSESPPARSSVMMTPPAYMA